MASSAGQDQRQDRGYAEAQSSHQPLRERVAMIIGRLDMEAEDRVSKRDITEKRWLTDLRQLHGAYDEKIVKDLRDAGKSTLFINQTRQKTNAMEARLSDMLFPTDDRNWGIEPTPVPELTVEAEHAAIAASEAKQAAVENPEDQALQQRAAEAEQHSLGIHQIMDEARKRARAMEEEIADQLKECGYALQARDVIRDGCRLGTGVIKGPIIGGRTRRTWVPANQAERGKGFGGVVAWLRDRLMSQETGVDYTLQEVTDPRPVFWRVDPWNFFPDMDSRSMEDCESVYERHLMKAKELRALAKQPGFDADAIRRLLADQPRTSTPTYIADLRSITGAYHDDATDRYHVWEYHGPLTGEEMQVLAMALDPTMLEDLENELVDPLEELNVVIWFCQGEVLKFGIHHLDSGDGLYSVFNLEKDDASIFGFGVPYLMRDSQKAHNAAWRTMMDNAGIASGPQIVVDKEVVEPVDGDYVIKARKVWRKKSGAPPNSRPFETYNIDMHQAELANIIELTRHNIDDETGMPVIAQGEQGTHTTQTAHGMSILMNATNVVFRRIVKNWDDDVTTQGIRRIYDWNMQFSPKEHIKGDYEVDARGTSVLLVREMQAANLMAWLDRFPGHPILGRFLKRDGLPGLRRLTQAMMIPSDEMVKADEEIAEDDAKAAEQPPPVDPEMEKIAAQLNLKKMELEGEERIALINQDTTMMQLAAQHNMTLEELRTKLQIKRMETGSRERMFASEAAIEERMAARGQAGGSGGYISAKGTNGNGRPEDRG